MKKKLLLGISIAVALLALVGLWFWYSMGQPLYQPGMARALALDPPPQSGEAAFWTVEKDTRLYHFSEGAGKNVLVIHGGPGFPFHQGLAGLKPLVGGYRFHYYHQRGCGQSTRPIDRFASSNYYENVKTLDRTLGLAAQIADIERIRRILGEEKLILLGHSFGGFLAALYAAEFPERVKGLVLVAPADLLRMPAEDGGLFEQVRAWLPAGMRQEYAGFLKRYLDFGGIFARSEAELQALNAEFGKYYLAAAAARKFSLPAGEDLRDNGGWMVQAVYFGMGRRHDYCAALKDVRVPALVIHGARDLQPEKASRAVAGCFSNARVAVIQEAGHFPFSDRPEPFAAAVGKFLSDLN